MIIRAGHLSWSIQAAARFAHWKVGRARAAWCHGKEMVNAALAEAITSLVGARLVEHGCFGLKEECFQLWTLDLFLHLQNDSSGGCTVLSCRVESKNSAKRAKSIKIKSLNYKELLQIVGRTFHSG